MYMKYLELADLDNLINLVMVKVNKIMLESV